jgi:DDE superfamily endonuclease
VVRFRNNVRVPGLAIMRYNPVFGKETVMRPGRGQLPWLAPIRFIAQPSPMGSWKKLARKYAARPHLIVPCSDHNWHCWSIHTPTGTRNNSASVWVYRADRSIAGGNVGRRETSPWRTIPDAAVKPLFPPRDHALVKALACERVAETGEPISRQSLADLTSRVQRVLRKDMSRSTVWRILDEDAIKPWRYEYWIFPRDPQFLEKAGPILDLYAGNWGGKPLKSSDFILSADEKTSIQARIRIHPSLGPGPGRAARVEFEYERGGALQYLAVWDVRRGYVMGRCEPTSGIEPFGRLVNQVLGQEPYRSAKRLFWIVDNGSSHRGEAACNRLRKVDPRIILVHTPVHASWLNQVEIYFSIIQRKVLTPNDFADLDAVRMRLALYENLTNQHPKPFVWKFTRDKLANLLKRIAARERMLAGHFATQKQVAA